MATTHEPLDLDKWILEEQKLIDIPTSFIWIIFCLRIILNMTIVRSFKVMLGQVLNHSV
jgi:hypothetical protein